MEMQAIPLSALKLSEHNVRGIPADDDALQELKASIKAHGVIENLIVTDRETERYGVAVGGRRLLALNQLADEGEIGPDHPVPCSILENGVDASEVSLAENMIRVAMHPVDQVKAFVRLWDSGVPISAIAARFGCSERLVSQRLRLGQLPGEILEAYRDGKIRMEALQAFALTTDVKRQLRVFEHLTKTKRLYSHMIRSELQQKAVRGDDTLALFVGREAYEAAGGRVNEDLFSQQLGGRGVYFEDAELLRRLADKKLEEQAEDLREEWGWVEVAAEGIFETPLHGVSRMDVEVGERTDEEKEELATVDGRMETIEHRDGTDEEKPGDDEEYHRLAQRRQALHDAPAARAWGEVDPAEKAKRGVFLSVDYDGSVNVKRGFAKKEDAGAGANGGTGDSNGGEPEEFEYSAALKDSLAEARTDIVRTAMIPFGETIAIPLLTFQLARGFFAGERMSDDSVRIGPEGAARWHVKDAKFGQYLKEGGAELPLDWLRAGGIPEQWKAFMPVSQEDKMRLLSALIALYMYDQLGNSPRASFPIEAIAGVLISSFSNYWRPTADDFWRRLAKPHALQIAGEVLGEAWVKDHRKMKKADLCDALEAAFEHNTWLPPGFIPEEDE